MDYEKEYKKRLDDARYWHNVSEGDIPAVLEEIFPELRESEGEKIRDEIILYIGAKDDISLDTHNKWIAWLEKQGDIDFVQYEDNENEKRKFVGYGFLKCKGDFLSFREGETYWLEYVGKDNYNVRSDNLLGQTFHIKPVELYTVFRPTTWLEKQGQKPADGVEPKFKVGDWITDGQLTCKVLSVTGKSYELHLYNDDYCHFETDIQHVDKQYHLWTIQDAKDGDVLVNGSNIFIFHFINDTRLMGYCHVNIDDGRFYDDLGKNECFCLIDAVVNPATKEQRDLLFAKMKEAGYMWDSKSKQLLSLKAEPSDIQNPTGWSEEDEDMVRYIGNAITCRESAKYLKEKGVDMIKAHRWLESFKPQINQQWSEEDENIVDGIINAVKDVRCQSLLSEIEIYDDYIDWLKSLKQRYTWKPSNEQLYFLSWLANIKLGDSVVEQEVSKHLNELYEDLKKL